MKANLIQRSFYLNHNVVSIARSLIGKYLVTETDGLLTKGMITETEAYCGETDAACHAFLQKKTKRTEVMFESGGIAYVYLVYGIHELFNIVTNVKDKADAVLIRSVEPVHGIEHMEKRRGLSRNLNKLSAGPGNLSVAMGISRSLCGYPLYKGYRIWLEQPTEKRKIEIAASSRIGIGYAGEDAHLPWRFVMQNTPFISIKP